MKKQKDNRPTDNMRLSIEFAENGIVIRNPYFDDDYILVALQNVTPKENGLSYICDHSDEYKAIGRVIYDWLTEVVVEDHEEEWITTGAELNIVATLNGREKSS